MRVENQLKARLTGCFTGLNPHALKGKPPPAWAKKKISAWTPSARAGGELPFKARGFSPVKQPVKRPARNSPVAAAFVLLLAAALCAPVHADPLRVAAAANLQKIFTEALLPLFTKKTGVPVLPTYGATKLLATQIENGAPIDVFVAADTETPQKLLGEHLLAVGTVQPYAVGQLVVWTRRDAAHHPATVQELASPVYAKIAYANPKTAPYGLAAVQAFSRTGLTATVAPRLVQAENIGQALQFAQSGNADAALTALSLVIEDKTDPYFVIPGTLHAPLTQSLGLVSRTTLTTQALQFIDFLRSRDADKIWKRYGYALPKRAEPKQR